MSPPPSEPWFQSLTIFFPMWNEEATIERAVAAAFEAGDDLVRRREIGSYEVLIVDDASTDGTGAIADKLASVHGNVRVVHHDQNRKLGGSLKTGFASAQGELVLYTDADLPFDMAEAAKAVRLLRLYQADIVSAYRFDRTGEGVRRLVYSYVYNRLVQTMFGLRVRDMNFAFKLVRRRVFDHVHLESEGSFIDVELLARAHRLGYQIVQFGVDYFPRTRGISTLSSNSVIVTILREMVALRGELQSICRLPDDVLRLDDARLVERLDERGVKLLIVNADDYGLTEGVSRAVLDAHRDGIVTSTSVLAVGPAFDRTCGWLADAPELGLGAHLAVVGEDPPVLTAAEIPTLVDRRGRFASSWRRFLPRAAAGRVDPGDLRREFSAQLERLDQAGLTLDHLDTHQNIHLWPSVREVVLQLGRERGLDAIRVTRSSAPGVTGAVVRRLADALADRCREEQWCFPETSTGLDGAGHLDLSAMLVALRRLATAPGATAELATHPGSHDDSDLVRYRWGYLWGAEGDALRSPEVRREVRALGFELGRFADLAAAR